MPAPDSPVPESSLRHEPICTIASWVVPSVGGLVTAIIYQNAVVRRSNGDWLPGIGELLIGIIIMALAGFGFGLAAFLRRERNRWLALLPFLAGLGFILYFGWNFLRHTLGSH